MAPSRIFATDDFPGSRRPVKRLKAQPDSEAEDDCDILSPHPLGIRPEGNAYTEESEHSHIRQHSGFYSMLPDELLIHFLDYLHPHELLSFGSTCKALYAFTHVDELWKAHFVNQSPKEFSWLGSWRSTYWQFPSDVQSKVSCSGLYSDVLHRPFFCTHASLTKYAKDIPARNSITRLSNLTHDEFSKSWSSKPFILTDPVRSWPIYSDWSITSLLKDHSRTPFRAEAVDWPLEIYVTYMSHQTDESPLYLFDHLFAAKMNLPLDDNDDDKTSPNHPPAYQPPTCFGPDLFALLGPQRPHSRWLIVGPARSGSTFHKDPNATSAWNAVLKGSKYWLMFPSGSGIPPPPGVILSDDSSEITAPLSIAEYLLSFHAIARATPGCREGVCQAGEVLHVPGGWFHLVLNLEEGIAVTQNFVPRGRVADVLGFLRDCPEQVSGFSEDVGDPYGLFVERLRDVYPALLDGALRELDGRVKGKVSKWDRITKREEKAGEFSFGFGGDEYSDDDS